VPENEEQKPGENPYRGAATPVEKAATASQLTPKVGKPKPVGTNDPDLTEVRRKTTAEHLTDKEKDLGYGGKKDKKP
jgi:hypothetical protein